MTDHQRHRVLMAGPPAKSAGGMAAVAAVLAGSCDDPTSRWSCALLDSGGGTGRHGYPKFGYALAATARQKYDLLHLHVATSGSTLRKAMLAEVAARRGIPYVIHLHGSGYFHFLDDSSPRVLKGVRRFFRGAARVIVLGETWRQLVITRLHVPSDRVEIVHNGVPPILGQSPEGSITDPGMEGNVILFVGELSERKGVDLLIEALQDIMHDDQFRDVRAVLVGPTPDEKLLGEIRRVNEEVGGRIDTPGALFGEAKSAFFAQAAILTLPSRKEALPMALLEAMTAGIPCITTDVGSIREIFPQGSSSGAVVLSHPNADLLRDALAGLLMDPDERRRIGAAGRLRWESAFTAAAMCDRVQRCWTDVTRKRISHPRL